MSSQFPKIDTVSDILTRVKINNKPLEKSQIDKLIKLKHKNNTMLNLKNRAFIYDIVGLINILGFEKAYDYLKKNQKNDHDVDIIKQAYPFREAKLQYYLDITARIREKADQKLSIYECPRCKAKNVQTETKQTRRADEAITEINKCRECGYTWRQ
jgi:DNA-directed RNA polymerase subunit M/transcription elongation factor TFIIS